MLSTLFRAVVRRACRYLGHADDEHDTGLVRVLYCRHCRRVTIDNYTGGVKLVEMWGTTDAAGWPTAAPTVVLVREVAEEDSP